MTLPTGTVTFLFTDIVGSTRLVQQTGAGYAALQAEHDAILRETSAAHSGVVANTEGDAFFIAFERAADAVAAAADIQRGLAEYPWPENNEVRVRMGLHTGHAQLGGDNYVGLDVHRAARIAAAGHGGQVLLSEATAILIGDGLPDGVTLLDLGQHRLKDLHTPLQLYQLLLPGLRSDFPPLRSLEGTPNNLPGQVTSFVGREKELAEITELLGPSGSSHAPRVLTLIGPGGTGKTRLSIQAAAEMLDRFPDGVWLVELAPLADPQQVIPALASILNLRETPDRPLESLLLDYLRRRQLLLILDNCEHLIDECARLADLLQRHCPRLHIIASSREALGIAGERVYRVPSLPLPPEHSPHSAAGLCEYAAVQLFLDRARTVQPDFAITAANCASLVQICRRLDGIPLAIELAAARVRVLSPEQIAARLDDRFRLLTGGSRTALPRQRTLAALIDWSYDLLSQPECILLRRLSVFSGGWTLEAAEAVCSDDGVEAWEVLDLLDQLVSKSLVVTTEREQGMRYHMLETIRQYAQEKLAESGEAEVLRDRHLAYVIDLNGRARDAIFALNDVQGWVNQLRSEIDNIQAARAWALERDLRRAMELAGLITVRWSAVEQLMSAYRFVETVSQRSEADPAFGPEGTVEDRRLLAGVLASATTLILGLGRIERLYDLGLKTIALASEVNNLPALSIALGMTATAAAMLGQNEQGLQFREQAITISDQVGNELVSSLLKTGSITYLPQLVQADKKQAWAEWEEGMTSLARLGDHWGLGMGHQNAARAMRILEDDERARYHAEASLAAFTQAGDDHFVSIPRSILAELALRRRDWDQAEAILLGDLPTWHDSGNRGAVAHVLELLAYLYRGRAETMDVAGDGAGFAKAATLFGAAAAIRSAYDAVMLPSEREEYEREVAALRAHVDETVFADAWRKGGAMDLDQAVAWTLHHAGGNAP